MHFLCSKQFIFVECHASVEFYAVFRVEAMHKMFFGICKIVKYCLIRLLLDPDGTSSAIK